MPDPVAIDRFWSHVDQSGGPDACWPWLTGKDKDGYGKYQYFVGDKQRHVRAHRFALMVSRGDSGPAGMHWKCDNPPCCNPAHLKWGTQRENRADCKAKGRQAKGLDIASSKLSDADLVAIADAYRNGERASAIGRRFDITRNTVWAIGVGKYSRISAHGSQAT